jgi:hypothetical protein
VPLCSFQGTTPARGAMPGEDEVGATRARRPASRPTMSPSKLISMPPAHDSAYGHEPTTPCSL